jgi:hypothetical protein
MRKRIIQKLTMLAFVAMVGIPAFAQGGKFGTNAGVATTIGFHPLGTVFDYKELKLEVTEEGPYMVEVIGFSDAVKANPSLLDGSDERFVEKTLVIPHVIEGGGGDPTTIFEGVRANAFAEVGADLVSMVTYLQIDYNASYVASNPGTSLTAIGANAFAGLTSVATVTSFSPTPPTCSEDAFASSVKTLIVPAGTSVMGLYAKPNAKAWRKIATIKNTDGLKFGDVDKDGRVRSGDLTTLQSVIKGKKPANDACDVDGDGRVRSGDLTTLQKEIKSNYR